VLLVLVLVLVLLLLLLAVGAANGDAAWSSAGLRPA
jgi:hypothetical protein